MTKHTPGRLHLSTLENMGPDGEPYWYLECEEEARVGMEFPNATTIVDAEGGILTEADARRLMECWNACVGVSPYAMPDLVAAMQKISEESVTVGKAGGVIINHNTMEKASAALAKAEPSSQ